MNNDISLEISKFLDKVDYLLPFNSEIKKIPLDFLKKDIMDGFHSDKNFKLETIIGTPLETAKALYSTYEFIEHKAGFLVRSLAFIFDLILIFIFSFASIFTGVQFIIFTQSTDVNSPILTILIYILILITYLFGICFLLLYFIILEKYYSTTLGKYILGLRVIDKTGIKISWKQAVTRSISKIIFIIPLFNIQFIILDVLIGYIYNRNEKVRGLDIIAETIVIREKVV
ncbi:MAG: hypothetical protein HeimC3_43620 [Candidatus Heimdallarchaeota archaeon LC_3]|nr:MAG: hypothetical protein HeimC3_43620 [Candidatus Heimdallarchaeota archaeon LC_3]